ncbi:hypothetical protein HDV06_002067 [Boothiomyces sp. JEL0866]|nr:hypothetical protein HDV06_002067 [Boothiomyces sp. JEL0866]
MKYACDTCTKRKTKSDRSIKTLSLPTHLADELYQKNHDHLLDLRFTKFPCIIFGIREQFYRESAKISQPLKYALYATGSLFLKSSQIPKELNHFQETIMYFRLALFHAKSCQINSEEGISKITVFDYEKENIRRLWWLIYRNYCTFSKLLGMDMVDDGDSQIFLPSNNFHFEHLTPLKYYGIEIISSKEWYTPSIPNQSLASYHILLQRIQSKINQHMEISLSGNQDSALYQAGAINASLIEWFGEFNANISQAIVEIRGEYTHLGSAWFTIYIAIIYCSLRINLILPNFFKGVLSGGKVQNILYFQYALDSALLCAQLVSLVKLYNPKLQYFAGAALLALFPPSFFLQCCQKMGFKVKDSYDQIVEGIKIFNWAFQKMNQFYKILILLESKDITDSIIYYRIFTARQMDELMEQQSANYVDLLEKLHIDN